MFGLFKDIQFSSKVLKFRMVAVFSINDHYTVIICVLLLYIKVIMSGLTSKMTYIQNFWRVFYFICDVQLDRTNQDAMTFWMEMLTITKKPVAFYIKTKIFEELKIKQISSNVSDFLQVNSTQYYLKNVPTIFLPCPQLR